VPHGISPTGSIPVFRSAVVMMTSTQDRGRTATRLTTRSSMSSRTTRSPAEPQHPPGHAPGQVPL